MKQKAEEIMGNEQLGRLLCGKKELQLYLEERGAQIGSQAVDTLIKAGLPGVRIANRLYFHSYNVDRFLICLTRQKVNPDEENGS